MLIHVVRPGDTVYSLALEYGLPQSQIALDNGLEPGESLVVGQALVLRFPQRVHTVRPGETLSSIAREEGVRLRSLYQDNPILAGGDALWPGETLVLSYRDEPSKEIFVNAYAYPEIPGRLLRSSLPFLSFLTPFTYGFTPAGTLVVPRDEGLLAAARAMGVAPLMHLSTLTETGSFSNELAHLLLNDAALQQVLTDNLVTTLREKGYRGLDVDFEYVSADDAGAYAAFLSSLTRRLGALGLPVLAALAPKTSANQKGLLYEGHDYAAIGRAVNEVLLMTYEWGYTYGPPMAVAPLPNVRRVVEYALTEIPAEKIWLGMPNYGYDWPLPYVKGVTKAASLSSRQAVDLARRHRAEIHYDQYSQSPWFRYTDAAGAAHEVWFEDARSVEAKLSLLPRYGLRGVGYWNLMREFPQNWLVLSSLFRIRQVTA